MKVTLLDAVFAHCPDDPALIEVLQTGFEGRHIVISSSDISTLAVQGWLNRQSEQIQDSSRLAIEDGLLRDAAENMRLQLSIDDRGAADDDWTTMFLSLESARQLLRKPLNVWFENDLNDGQFLLSTARQEVRDRLVEWKEKGWIQFQNAGGIDSIPERSKGLGHLQVIRTMFIFDSDARLPAIPSTSAKMAIDSCRVNDATWHCLERRAIENYIPPGTLKAWASKTDLRGPEGRSLKHAVWAFSRLSAEQRCHFNLKKGFDRDSRSTATTWSPEDLVEFWKGVSDDDRGKLNNGIQSGIAQKIFGSGLVPYSHLVNDKSNAELDTIAQMLMEGV